jgi:opacity protein-like surface antigen
LRAFYVANDFVIIAVHGLLPGGLYISLVSAFCVMSLRLIPFISLLALCLVFVAAPARAQTTSLYFAGYMGLNTYGDQDYSESGGPSSGSLQFDNGYAFSGALGLRLSKTLRVEAEFLYNSADIDNMDISGAGTFKAGGEFTSWAGMANVYYDFDVPWAVQPYVGAGVGYGFYNAKIIDNSGLASTTDSDTSALAWQLGGGLKYRVSPELAFTTGYRYLATTELDIGSYSIDYSSHEFRIGLEYDLPFE